MWFYWATLLLYPASISCAGSVGKRGLGWPSSNVDPISLFGGANSKVSWLYDWSPFAPSNFSQSAGPNSSIEFVPMQWNGAEIESLAARTRNASVVLGFNEPERSDQANMPVATAAALWVQYFEPLRKAGIRCGSPGISSGSDGATWLTQFLAAIRAKGSDVDFYAIHWYGDGLGGFYDYLWAIYYQLGADKPVWITEFAATNGDQNNPLSKDVVQEFLYESEYYLDSLDWIERYAWFGAMRDTGGVGKWAELLNSTGLTELGELYRYDP